MLIFSCSSLIAGDTPNGCQGANSEGCKMISKHHFQSRHGFHRTLKIKKPGKYCLAKDIGYKVSKRYPVAIVVDADHVELDLAGHRLYQANDTAGGIGVYVKPNRFNVTVLNGTVDNFTCTGVRYVKGCTLDINKDCSCNKCASKEKPVLNPINGVPYSSQAVKDAIDEYREVIFKVAPSALAINFLEFNQFVDPPNSDFTYFTKWPQYDAASVTENTQLVLDTIEKYRNIAASIPNLYEDERQVLTTLGYDASFWRALPSVSQVSSGEGGYVDISPMIGTFYTLNSYYGESLMPYLSSDLSEQLSLTTASWNNFADAMPDYLTYMNDGIAANLVCSAIDVNGSSQRELWGFDGLGLRVAAYYGGEFTTKTADDFIDGYIGLTAYIEQDILNFLNGDPSDIEGTGPNPKAIVDTIAFQPFLAGTPAEQMDGEAAFARVRDQMKAAITMFKIGGAYELKAQELRSSSTNPGLAGIPEPFASEQYAFGLTQLASTNFTPQEIFSLGLEQTKNIQDELVVVVNEILANPEYNPGGLAPVTDFDDFNYRFRNDIDGMQNVFRVEMTVQEIIDATKLLIQEAESAGFTAFQNLARAPIEVFPSPGFGAASGFGGLAKNDGTGTVIVSPAGYILYVKSNTLDPDAITVQERSLDSSTAYHEAFPGHAYQISLAQEWPPQLPNTYVGGASEGWALYVEKVAVEDMGLADPLTVPNYLFRRYDYLINRLFRANRLVIDPALHSTGLDSTGYTFQGNPIAPTPWNYDYALEWYLGSNTVDAAFITTEVDRYIVWPGQACAYLTGALAIDEQRKRAEDALGDLFDLKEFHDVLIHFTVNPQQVIEELTSWYISQKLTGCFDKNWPPVTRQVLRAPLRAITECTPCSSVN